MSSITEIEENNIQCALSDLPNKHYCSIRAAARAYGVSVATLARRANTTTGTREAIAEACQKLERQLESRLVQWVLNLEASRLPCTCRYLPEMANNLNRAIGYEGRIGDKWALRFLKRQSMLKSKLGKKIDRLRTEHPDEDPDGLLAVDSGLYVHIDELVMQRADYISLTMGR